eukprot:TRINITY_DN2977_c0_g1_i1.p1 TRINITY_DN2977_c0_g1~~TRINITY_DN2977_c0_g1_i1.p1  ORF type:complete len:232 (-),score=94.39 TRINITY_DN2977_c0_g1_i1:23-679(-)
MADPEDIKEYLDNLMRVVNDNEGWAPVAEKRGIVVESKTFDDDAIPTLRGSGVIQAPASKVLELLLNPDERHKWDLFYDSGRKIVQLDEHTALCYVKTQSYYTVWPRDFCFLAHGQQIEGPGGKDSEKEIRLVSSSVESDDAPEVSGIVRAQILNGGYRLLPIQSPDGGYNWTHATYVIQLDIAGWIPGNVASMVNTYQPLSLIGIRKCLTGSTAPPS